MTFECFLIIPEDFFHVRTWRIRAGGELKIGCQVFLTRFLWDFVRTRRCGTCHPRFAIHGLTSGAGHGFGAWTRQSRGDPGARMTLGGAGALGPAGTPPPPLAENSGLARNSVRAGRRTVLH